MRSLPSCFRYTFPNALSGKPAEAQSVLVEASAPLAWQEIHLRTVANRSRFSAARDVPGRDRPLLVSRKYLGTSLDSHGTTAPNRGIGPLPQPPRFRINYLPFR